MGAEVVFVCPVEGEAPCAEREGAGGAQAGRRACVSHRAEPGEHFAVDYGLPGLFEQKNLKTFC